MIKIGEYVFETKHKGPCGNFELQGLVTAYPTQGNKYVVLNGQHTDAGWYMTRFCTSSLGHVGKPCVFCGQDDYWE